MDFEVKSTTSSSFVEEIPAPEARSVEVKAEHGSRSKSLASDRKRSRSSLDGDIVPPVKVQRLASSAPESRSVISMPSSAPDSPVSKSAADQKPEVSVKANHDAQSSDEKGTGSGNSDNGDNNIENDEDDDEDDNEDNDRGDDNEADMDSDNNDNSVSEAESDVIDSDSDESRESTSTPDEDDDPEQSTEAKKAEWNAFVKSVRASTNRVPAKVGKPPKAVVTQPVFHTQYMAARRPTAVASITLQAQESLLSTVLPAYQRRL